jgi:hypothetical protein
MCSAHPLTLFRHLREGVTDEDPMALIALLKTGPRATSLAHRGVALAPGFLFLAEG